MPRVRAADAPRVVHRCARIALRTTTAQRRRLFAQLVAGGDVWAWVLALNEARVAGGEERIVSYQALCRELSARGRASSNELSVSAARSVLRRYCDACFAVARARRAGDERAPFRAGGATSCRCAFTPGRFHCSANSCASLSRREAHPFAYAWRARSPTCQTPCARSHSARRRAALRRRLRRGSRCRLRGGPRSRCRARRRR